MKTKEKALTMLVLTSLILSGRKKEVAAFDETPTDKQKKDKENEPKLQYEETVNQQPQESEYVMIDDQEYIVYDGQQEPVKLENITQQQEEQQVKPDDFFIKNDIVITTSGLNFRKEPNTNQKEILTFPEGMELKVVGETYNGWLLVEYNNQLGYVKKEYIKSYLEELQSKYPELRLENLAVEKIVYPTTGLNLRTQPNTECEIVKELETYEAVRVLEDYGDWYLVMTNEHELGFVNKQYTKELNNLFVEVDKSKQILYIYFNNELILTTKVVTGKDSTPSDTGLFKIYSKETDTYLTDVRTYNSHVNYWMPYNGGEGLHDATWKKEFGTEAYHTSGSHGCINLPLDIAKLIYGTVEVGTKVLVHK